MADSGHQPSLEALRKLREKRLPGISPPNPNLLDYTIRLAEAAEALRVADPIEDDAGFYAVGAALSDALDAEIPGLTDG